MSGTSQKYVVMCLLPAKDRGIMSNIENISDEQQDLQESANPMALQAIEAVLKELAQGNADAAIRLFIKDQTLTLLPKGADLVTWLIKTIGKQDTKTLIHAFAHAPCLNCKKGLQKCESCHGVGNFKHEVVCDSCFGIGSEICSFCGGTGWATIDFVPPGLRFMVFADRLKIAMAKVKALLDNPLLLPQSDAALGTLAEYAQLLVDLNRQIAVLEGVASAPMQIVKSAHVPMPRISEIIRKSVVVALKAKMRLLEIVKAMAEAAKMEINSYDKESKAYQMAVKAGRFLSFSCCFDSAIGRDIPRTPAC